MIIQKEIVLKKGSDLYTTGFILEPLKIVDYEEIAEYIGMINNASAEVVDTDKFVINGAFQQEILAEDQLSKKYPHLEKYIHLINDKVQASAQLYAII